MKTVFYSHDGAVSIRKDDFDVRFHVALTFTFHSFVCALVLVIDLEYLLCHNADVDKRTHKPQTQHTTLPNGFRIGSYKSVNCKIKLYG